MIVRGARQTIGAEGASGEPSQAPNCAPLHRLSAANLVTSLGIDVIGTGLSIRRHVIFGQLRAGTAPRLRQRSVAQGLRGPSASQDGPFVVAAQKTVSRRSTLEQSARG